MSKNNARVMKKITKNEEKFFVISKTDGEVDECETGDAAKDSIKTFLENGADASDIEVITGRRVTFAVHEETAYTVSMLKVEP